MIMTCLVWIYWYLCAIIIVEFGSDGQSVGDLFLLFLGERELFPDMI